VELGRGATLQSILAGRSTVAEGVATAAALVARAARLGVEMPVCAAVASVLDGSHTVADAVQRLLGRGQRDE
jgi:glycerol-3-phosphate dehydrogenase (NAD(P)+)